MTAAAQGTDKPGPAEARKPGRGIPAQLSAARLAAVQALYQIEMSGARLETVVDQFLKHRPEGALDEGEAPVPPKVELFTEIVRGAAARREELDDVLRAALPQAWPLERIEILLSCVLRAGIYELLARPSVPARVVITEYVDLADAFFEKAERGMVNAILDRVARRVRQAELPGDHEGGPDARTADA